MYILFSVLALSFIIFIHELGHFLFAKLFKVKVEVFSVGIGPSILKFKINDTEYRLSPILLGGYCKLKGFDHLEKELKANKELEADKDSLFGISHFKRILIYFAGPLFNLIFSFIVFIFISMAGVIYFDYSSRVSILDKNSFLKAKFRDGDVILKVNNKKIEYFSDLRKILPEEKSTVTFNVLRGKENVTFKETIGLQDFLKGIGPWIDLVVADVVLNSPAKIAGIKSGDKIISIDNIFLENKRDLDDLLKNLNSDVVEIKFDRNGEIFSSKLVFQDKNKMIGVYFSPSLKRIIKVENVSSAVKNSFFKVVNALQDILYSIFLLITNFLNTSKSVSGPVGIVGILSSSYSLGLLYWINSISFLSLILAGMNLFFIVIPVFDGGQIFISFIELLRGKRFKAKTIYYFYSFGIFFALFLFSLGLFNDLKGLLNIFN
ncbi:RIP metalloprotease RseP [Borrelia sp. CA_690]|uniref:Zinc metalloprotease n=1 Tax=Borrelia maritima TaxID=2761123 RepID=A0A5J6WB62_9SPIR|nr:MULTISPECIES: RIP metalloprotease RseP [Borrelia]QFI14271.1 RIP metalloprotease RseP [Borrelia maritima]WKC84126.1 RIP metalloprotease RseP [Borrelia sp. CA_690]